MPEANCLYVGNLPVSFDDKSLRKLFSHFGAISSLKLCQRENAQNKYGFVTFEEADNANEAKKQLNKKTVKEHQLRIDFARSANDLIIKAKASKPFKKNKKKRTFDKLSTSKASPQSPNSTKRRKLSKGATSDNKTDQSDKQQKQIPQSRIVKLTNIPKSVSFQILQQRLSDHQYLIYPSNDSTDLNTAWILHKTVKSAHDTIEKMNGMVLQRGAIVAMFARKLNAMYRVKVSGLNNKNETKIKAFMNAHFNKNYKFEEEENKKSGKWKKYVRKRAYPKKKSNKKYDVIQNANVKSTTLTVIEFKKVDYALFAVQNMNGIQFESNAVRCQFELEKYSQQMSSNKKQQTDVETEQSMEVESSENDTNIIKMFGIAKSVTFEKLKDLIVSIIGDKCNLIIYPAPDSLPQSQTAWICVKDDNEGVFGQKLIKKLNKTQINDQTVGLIPANQYIEPQKIMIRNLSDSVSKNDLYAMLGKFGRIKTIQMKPKNNSKFEHCGFCFVVFESVLSASNTMKELNGYSLHNKTMAIDYSLPKDIYNKVQNEWKQHQAQSKQIDIESNPFLATKEKTEPIWKLYAFMSDFEQKSFYQKYVRKNKKKKIKTFSECLDIEISSEPEDYDWLKWFLRNNRLHIIQYETNCKIGVDIKAANVEIISDNERDLQKGVAIIRDILKQKTVREVGYTQIMKIPYDTEHSDFDWILFLNGENYEKRKEFEYKTGCSFTFKGKLSSYLLKNDSDLLKLQLIGATKQSLQRGAHLMKDEMLSSSIKNERVEQMNYKCIHREYFPEKNKFEYDIDFIALIRSPNGQRLKTIESETKCKIRVFGSNFENKKKIKSYCKILAKNPTDLKKGCKVIHDLIHNEEVRANALRENNNLFARKTKEEKEKRFWFYAGDANEGRTIFVRNLPYEIAESEIMEKFNEFGRIISCKSVFDKITGNSRGCCFIQFDDKEDVDRILNNHLDISLNGRKLQIDLAVNKKEANKIERVKQNNKDKRNLYLAKEGIIINESDMNAMDKKELNRRIEAWKEKKIKLANPNYHVSKTRLSVRNIPGFVNEKFLKKVFYEKAVEIRKEFENDQTKKNDIFEHKFPKINQVKVVRDNDRLNDKGIGRSKRFGFVEFREHSDSLLVLRALNNQSCSQVFGGKEPSTKSEKEQKKMGNLTIEFSVENMKKLFIHYEKTKNHQKKWKNTNLEQLRDKLEVHRAQNQKEEIKAVEAKINEIKQSFDEEQVFKKKQNKQKLKMVRKKKDKFYDKKRMKKYRRSKTKGKKNGIKHV